MKGWNIRHIKKILIIMYYGREIVIVDVWRMFRLVCAYLLIVKAYQWPRALSRIKLSDTGKTGEKIVRFNRNLIAKRKVTEELVNSVLSHTCWRILDEQDREGSQTVPWRIRVEKLTKSLRVICVRWNMRERKIISLLLSSSVKGESLFSEVGGFV